MPINTHTFPPLLMGQIIEQMLREELKTQWKGVPMLLKLWQNQNQISPQLEEAPVMS